MLDATRCLTIFICATLLAAAGCVPDENEQNDLTLTDTATGESDAGTMNDTGIADTGGDEDTRTADPDTSTSEDTGAPPNDTGTMADTTDAGMDTGGTEEDTSMMPTAEEVDPNCLDGKYSEPLPDPSADISSAKANYSESNVKSFFDTVLGKRYPVGKWIIDGGLEHGQQDCVEPYLRNASTADGALQSLSTVVHECGHFFDLGVGGFSTATYKITKSTSFSCSGGDTTSRGGKTFARSKLTDDNYQSELPPCGGNAGRDCDSYADTYLIGNGSEQGFNSVLEETLQYVNSLATSYAIKDTYGRRSTSALDGILTFLWYVERYLRLARTEHPNAYNHLTETPCWRKAILTIWGRAWLMIEAAESEDQLGINEQKLFDLVRTPELLEEIDRVRQAHGCN